MEIKDNISNQILFIILKDILIVLVLIFLTFFLVLHMLNSNKGESYIDGDLFVELDKKIDSKLDKMYDKDGLNIKGNNITITNNGDATNYEILVCDVDNPDGVRIGIDKFYIRTLGNQIIKNNCYLIYEGSINDSTTYMHTIRFWYKSDYIGDNNVNSKWNLEVKNVHIM